MGKKELVQQVAKGGRVSQVAAQEVIESTLSAIRDRVLGGERITIKGFGSFYSKERAARVGRNPKTGEKIEIPARRVVKFTPAF